MYSKVFDVTSLNIPELQPCKVCGICKFNGFHKGEKDEYWEAINRHTRDFVCVVEKPTECPICGATLVKSVYEKQDLCGTSYSLHVSLSCPNDVWRKYTPFVDADLREACPDCWKNRPVAFVTGGFRELTPNHGRREIFPTRSL